MFPRFLRHPGFSMLEKLTDGKRRVINTLRISITDQCNLKCFYCKPENFSQTHHVLSCQEIENLLRIFARLGITRVRITGGEPLVRKDIVSIIERIVSIPGIEDVSLTTNGVFLAPLAKDLKKAGLKRVNISLDTLDRKKYEKITGSDSLLNVIKGIWKALEIGFYPVKINVVVMKDINDSEIIDFLKFAKENLIVRFIEYMPVKSAIKNWKNYFVSGDEILKKIEFFDEFYKQDNLNFPSSGSADYFRFKNKNSLFGIICSVSHPFCYRCNRIRVDSSGRLFLCLYNENFFDIRNLTKTKVSDKDIDLLRRFILKKQGSSNFLTSDYLPEMCHIGG